MIIKEIIYKHEGLCFNNLEQIERNIDDQLGKFIDECFKNDSCYNSKQRLMLFKYIKNNQGELNKILGGYLDLEIEKEREEEREEEEK